MKNEHSQPPQIERLFGGQPILQKDPNHPWENRVTFNPACVLVASSDDIMAVVPKLPFDNGTKNMLMDQPALVFMVYRAQGEKTEMYDYTRSSFGLAIFTTELELLARHSEPIIVPDEDYEDLGVEDGRLTKVGRRWVLVYTAYGTAENGTKNNMRIAMASTTDFVTWVKHGLVQARFNAIDNKNGMIFEKKVGKKHVMLHRPMEGPDAMAIHWADTDDVYYEWRTRGVLMRPIRNPEFESTWVGGGAPPLKLPDGRYLILYHIGNRRTDGSREYRLGIAVGDPGSRIFIVKRTEPIFRPETSFETTGDPLLGVNNVVFVCGAYFWDGDLYFPYTGANSVVLAARISRGEIEQYTARQ